MSKRIVVTGMGAVSPLGCGVEPIWQRLLAGQSGIATLPAELIGDLPISIGGQVPDRAQDPQAGFDPDLLLAAKEQRKMDRFILFALAAAQEALAQAGWAPQSAEAQERTATVIASGVGGFHAIAEAVRTTDGKGPRRLSPFTIPSFLCNMAAAHVSIRHGFKGPLGAPVTACAAGVQAIGDAARMIRAGEVDVALCGGAEATIHRVSLAGFAAARPVQRFQRQPRTRLAPLRPGPRRLRHGRRRRPTGHRGTGARPGARRQAHRRAGGLRHQRRRLPHDRRAGRWQRCPPGHAAGAAPGRRGSGRGATPECPRHLHPGRRQGRTGRHQGRVRRRQQARHQRDQIRHRPPPGAAGGIEAIFTVLALRDQLAPATLNLETPDTDAEGLDLVRGEARRWPMEHALSNGFGFGGVNASLLFRRWV